MPKQNHRRSIEQLTAMSKSQEGQRQLTSFIYAVLNDQGILSLSSDPHSMLMWSYYSQGHRGIALRFRTSSDILISLGARVVLVPVTYKEDFPLVRYYHEKIEEVVAKMIQTKAKCWTHESEWRFIAFNHHGYLKVPKNLITGVVFGLNTPSQVQDQIRKWTSSRTPRIEFFRVMNELNSFDLKMVPA